MLIMDSQVHVWPAHRPDRPLAAHRQDQTPYTYEELLAAMDEAGVDRAILVPPTFDGDRNDYALAAAAEHPDRFAVMGRVSLPAGKGNNSLAGWLDQPGMLGVRLTFHRPEDRPWLTDGTADWFWGEAEENGIPVMVHAPEGVQTIRAVAERHPGLAIIYDHMACGRDSIDERAAARIEELLPLARLPNVSVKVSALPCFSTAPYPFANLNASIRKVIESFGPERSYWGSDITRIPATVPYRQVVTHFTEALDFLSPGDLELIMGKALAKRLRWPAVD